MKVGYSKVMGGIMNALGVVNLVLAAILASMGASAIGPVIPGVVTTFIGIMYFSKPYFLFDDERIVVKALIGPLKRETAFEDKEALKREGNKIYVQTPQGRKKVPVSRWIADKGDWEAFLRYLDL